MLISFTAEVATRSWDTNRSERQLIDHAVVCVCHLQVNIGSNFLKFEFYLLREKGLQIDSNTVLMQPQVL